MSGALPVYRESLRKAMGHPLGERIIVRPFPPSDDANGIVIPDLAKSRPFAGRIVAAGDQACDKLWDLGVELGDEVWWAKFAGIIEMWTHITKDPDKDCDSHDWAFMKSPQDRVFMHQCSRCGAERIQEPMIVLNVEDIMVDVDLQERVEKGVFRRERGQTEDGKTRYVIERTEEVNDSWAF